jgi:NADH dehydrogenase
MKSLAEAREIRKALLGTYEEVAAGHLAPEALHTVVIGGGPTGVELAGAVAELQRGLAREFPEIAKEAGVELVEAGPRLLPSFSEKSSETALRDLTNLGVHVFTGVGVTKVGPQEVLLSDDRILPAGVIIWAAGVAAPKIWSKLGETAAGNRIKVDDTLYLRDDIWVIGDASLLCDEAGRPLPQVAPVAMQGGRHVAKQILRMREGLEREKFRYKDKGQMATIGRRRAVVELPNGLKLTGTPAWLAWLLLHVAYLAGGRNRLSVVADWAWNYIAWGVGPPRTLTD